MGYSTHSTQGLCRGTGLRRTGLSQQLTSRAGRGICVCSMPLATHTPSLVTPPLQLGWRDLSSLKGNERFISKNLQASQVGKDTPCALLHPSPFHQTRHSMDTGSEPQESGAVRNTSWGEFQALKALLCDMFYPTSHTNPNCFG